MRKVSLILALALLAHGQPLLAKPSVAAAEEKNRFVTLEGGRNFRDVGGYATTDRRRVKWGKLYRSGSIGRLTDRDRQQLANLKVTSVIDLRATPERSADTAKWVSTDAMTYWMRDYSMSLGDTSRSFTSVLANNPSRETMVGMMAGAYRTMIKEQVPGYRELFARLLTDKGAVVVNCTAGKDRTGIAAALVLTSLGVPYAQVREDFLLSNQALVGSDLHTSLPPAFASLPADVLQPLLGVDGTYLDSAFDQIRKDYGTVDNYLKTEIGVGPKEVAKLRRRMLS